MVINHVLGWPPKPTSGAGLPLYEFGNGPKKKTEEQIFQTLDLILQTTISASRFHCILIPFIFNFYDFLFYNFNYNI
jgi:hypothetical protein